MGPCNVEELVPCLHECARGLFFVWSRLWVLGGCKFFRMTKMFAHKYYVVLSVCLNVFRCPALCGRCFPAATNIIPTQCTKLTSSGRHQMAARICNHVVASFRALSFKQGGLSMIDRCCGCCIPEASRLPSTPSLVYWSLTVNRRGTRLAMSCSDELSLCLTSSHLFLEGQGDRRPPMSVHLSRSGAANDGSF